MATGARPRPRLRDRIPGRRRGSDSGRAKNRCLRSQCPRAARPYWRGTWRDAALRGRLGDTQVAEVGRYASGAVKPDEKRGHKFRAPYSGYSLRQSPRLIPIKRVLPFARLGRCLSRKDQVYVQTEEAAAKVR